ncbi:MAG TPA: hypothetical protein VEZ11_05345 [Thermoanaerobaculia bacterium]|nr:hypothetical protein [Thermoanaerobaculia bacterium]
MSEDKFLDRLREEARVLRYEPDDPALTRLTARVRARVRTSSQPGVSQLLARWFRPLVASLAVMILWATVSVVWIERAPDSSLDSLFASSNGVEIQLDGDTYSVID